MFRGEGDSEEAWPDEPALRSDGCRRSMAAGGLWGGVCGEGMEQGDVAKDGGSAWIVMAGKKEFVVCSLFSEAKSDEA